MIYTSLYKPYTCDICGKFNYVVAGVAYNVQCACAYLIHSCVCTEKQLREYYTGFDKLKEMGVE